MDKLTTCPDDPINALVDAGVPVRILISHQLCSVDWLAARLEEKFRLCYFNEAGALTLEDVTALELLVRGKELGWNPLQDETEEAAMPFLFEEAIYHHRNGVHWYASATSDSDGMLPLGFPKSVLEADRKLTDRKMKMAKARQRREAASQARAAAAEARASKCRKISRLADRMHKEAAMSGKPISAATAKRKAQAWWRQWESDVASIMQSFAANQGGDPHGR